MTLYASYDKEEIDKMFNHLKMKSTMLLLKHLKRWKNECINEYL